MTTPKPAGRGGGTRSTTPEAGGRGRSEQIDQPTLWEPSIAFLRLTIRGLLAGSVLFLVVLFVFAPEQRIRALGPIGLCLLAGAAGRMLQRNQIKACVTLLVAGVWTLTTLMASVNGGVRAPVVILYPQIILMTGWLLSPRAAFKLAAVTFVTTIALAVAEAEGFVIRPRPTPPAMYAVVQGAVFTSTALLIHYLVRSYRNRLGELSKLGHELGERAEVLSVKQRELRLVAESVPSLIFHGDRDEVCLFVNRSFAELHGRATDELVGQSLEQIVGPLDYRTYGNRIERVLEGERQSFRRVVESKHDRSRTFDVDLVPELDHEGEARGFFLVLDDVTEKAEAERALVRLNEELEERVAQRTAQLLAAKNEAERASAAKTEFLSRMSHELRTPLNAILGFSELLEVDRRLGGDQLANVKEISSAGGQLLGLIDEVLDLSRVESGRLEVSLGPVPLGELLRGCAVLIEPVAMHRLITVRLSDACDGAVWADQKRLQQVVLNLLSNAVKYNRDGGTITIGRIRTGNGRIRIVVRDSGKGIAPDMLARLFQPFERLDAEAEGIEGTGIGLAISKRLVEAMGGVLGVESEPGIGSTFYIELDRPPKTRASDDLPSRRQDAVR